MMQSEEAKTDAVRSFQLDDDESAELEEKRAQRERDEARAAEERYRRIQDRLDEALAATFPASDPVSSVTSQDEEYWH